MICVICQSISTSDNPVEEINGEELCIECVREISEEPRSLVEKRWLELLRSA
jgi:hypothetical protein